MARKLSDEEKEEFLRIAHSEKLRRDMETIAQNRHNPFMVDGHYSIDRYIEFLNEYNALISHARPPFRKIIDKDMRL